MSEIPIYIRFTMVMFCAFGIGCGALLTLLFGKLAFMLMALPK